jgi:hypothetical protein
MWLDDVLCKIYIVEFSDQILNYTIYNRQYFKYSYKNSWVYGQLWGQHYSKCKQLVSTTVLNVSS